MRGQQRQARAQPPEREGVLLVAEEAHREVVDDLTGRELDELEALLVAVDAGVLVDAPAEVDVARVEGLPRHLRERVFDFVDPGRVPDDVVAQLEGEDRPALDALDGGPGI